jgi:hypothetical protein
MLDGDVAGADWTRSSPGAGSMRFRRRPGSRSLPAETTVDCSQESVPLLGTPPERADIMVLPLEPEERVLPIGTLMSGYR